jgi:hypothetical protein
VGHENCAKLTTEGEAREKYQILSRLQDGQREPRLRKVVTAVLTHGESHIDAGRSRLLPALAPAEMP